MQGKPVTGIPRDSLASCVFPAPRLLSLLWYSPQHAHARALHVLTGLIVSVRDRLQAILKLMCNNTTNLHLVQYYVSRTHQIHTRHTFLLIIEILCVSLITAL